MDELEAGHLYRLGTGELVAVIDRQRRQEPAPGSETLLYQDAVVVQGTWANPRGAYDWVCVEDVEREEFPLTDADREQLAERITL
jgi:hypothetical protein